MENYPFLFIAPKMFKMIAMMFSKLLLEIPQMLRKPFLQILQILIVFFIFLKFAKYFGIVLQVIPINKWNFYKLFGIIFLKLSPRLKLYEVWK